MYISRTEGVSSGFHQKWCCSHKHGLHAWFPFVILKFSPRNVELNDGHFFFPRMGWVSGRSFADEPSTIRLGTRRHMRALWPLRVTTCQEEEIFRMYFSGLAGWILLNYVTIKRLLLCVFLLQFQTKELYTPVFTNASCGGDHAAATTCPTQRPTTPSNIHP